MGVSLLKPNIRKKGTLIVISRVTILVFRRRGNPGLGKPGLNGLACEACMQVPQGRGVSKFKGFRGFGGLGFKGFRVLGVKGLKGFRV